LSDFIHHPDKFNAAYAAVNSSLCQLLQCVSVAMTQVAITVILGL